MRRIDYSPLMRATVGFDRMMSLLDAAAGQFDENGNGFPPYNIEKVGEDQYRITMAVAGFGEKDLDVTVTENRLVISGKQEKVEEEDERTYLHRGVATRSFERRFELAETIKVLGAEVENGLLHVTLVHQIPEAMKPRSIQIETKGSERTKAIDQKAA